MRKWFMGLLVLGLSLTSFALFAPETVSASSLPHVTIISGSLVKDSTGRIVASTGQLLRNTPALTPEQHPSTAGFHPSSSVPPLKVRPLTPCYSYWTWTYIVMGPNNVSIFETYANSSCNFQPPETWGYVANCTRNNQTYNNDVWLSQGTTPGSTRLAASGRTGLWTFTSDCVYHRMAIVTGWGQTWTSPLWACGWFYWQNYNISRDYLCTTTNIQ